MPEHDPEQELGPKIASALQDQVDAETRLKGRDLASEARRRVRKRRQSWTMAAAAAVVVAVGIGGVWSATNASGPVASTAGDSSGESKAAGPGKSTQGMVPPRAEAGCPPGHPILRSGGHSDVPAGTGLDLTVPVTGMQACRYQLSTGAVLGRQTFDAAVAQQVVDAIKVLPERNPGLPSFKCAPQTSPPAEAIVLRFDTSAGVREVWVQYDGCTSPGFFTGTHSYGLYAAPLKLFLIGSVRPPGGTYLNALPGW